MDYKKQINQITSSILKMYFGPFLTKSSTWSVNITKVEAAVLFINMSSWKKNEC